MLLLFSFDCLGQAKEQPSKADKLNLADPKPGSPSPEDTLMFKNSLVLFRKGYTVIYNSTANTFTNLKALSSYLQKTSPLLKRRKVYILIDSNTKPDKIVSVLDLLQKHRIENYKLVNHQEYFKPPPSNEYQVPPKAITVTRPDDSSYFSIKIHKDSLELTLLDKKQIVGNSAEVDKFISANKMQIDPTRIVFFADANTLYEKFKPILDVLRKHGYYKFKIIE